MPATANPSLLPRTFEWFGKPATGPQPGERPSIAPNPFTARSLITRNRYASGHTGNPWADASKSLQDRVNSVWQSTEAPNGGPFGGSTSPSVVHPEDQDVQSYLSHVMGGQRTAMDDYVKRAAGAEIKRGGFNVVGGPSMDSALHHSAMQDLAQGYGDLLRESVGYAKYARATQADQAKASMDNLLSLMKVQHDYLSSEADWESQQAKNQQALALANSIKKASSNSANGMGTSSPTATYDPLSNTEMARWKNYTEIENAKKAGLEEEAKATRWGRLMGTSPNDDYLQAEKTMIEQGLMSPIKRSVTLSKK